jgi:hypothetical protein
MRSPFLGLLLASVATVTACSSESPAPAGANGDERDAAADPKPDGGSATGHDGGAPDAATKDASPADGGSDSGVTATGSRPPAGSTLCGSGTFTPTDSLSECQGATPYFPAMYNVTKSCGGSGFTFSSGLWEAWCTASTVYLFARFENPTGFNGPGPSAPFGYFQSGNGSGTANAYFDATAKGLIVSAPNGLLSSKAGQLFLLHFDGSAGSVSNFTMVGGVALTWK